MNLLVTGGCGYIGSHVVRRLSELGHRVVAYDNLSTGSRSSLLHNEHLILGDLSCQKTLDLTFKHVQIDAILHFAASISVPESVDNPLLYYSNNTANTIALLKMCNQYQINKFIFSSTAAVYGESPDNVDENHVLNPASPYAVSKMMSEWVIKDFSKAKKDFKHVILRYFNVAGAEGRIGQGKSSSHLIKVACDVALGRRNHLNIFGMNYDTPDGTCIRDYIHVEDLALAHIKALDYLEAGGESDVFNCGYGRGFSVKEIVSMVKKVSGRDFQTKTAPPRQGDVVRVVANNDKICSTLGWKPKYDDIEQIVRSAYEWERNRP